MADPELPGLVWQTSVGTALILRVPVVAGGGIVTLNVWTTFGVACRDANHLIHTPSISA